MPLMKTSDGKEKERALPKVVGAVAGGGAAATLGGAGLAIGGTAIAVPAVAVIVAGAAAGWGIGKLVSKLTR